VDVCRDDSYTFSAGPAMLPADVLARIGTELPDWRETGFSVLELSQWDPKLLDMFEQTESGLRQLLDVPDDYAVLFLPGGASNQFAMVPMNLLRDHGRADYLHTGLWSGKALQEARRYTDVHLAASTAAADYRRAPAPDEVHLTDSSAYLHYTPLETAHGVQFPYVPDAAGRPLVADVSSALLTMPLDIGRFDLLYASTQKNLGVVGMTVVILRRELIGHADPRTPTTFDYAVHERTHSRWTTPPVFAWYVAGLMVDWARGQGGAGALQAACGRRAQTVYRVLDASEFYVTPVAIDSRSNCSVLFHLAQPGLTEVFLKLAGQAGLHGLRGHSAVGGLRASMYVGMPASGADALAEFLTEFERTHG
jgi:phosphoserine aminotransferase